MMFQSQSQASQNESCRSLGINSRYKEKDSVAENLRKHGIKVFVYLCRTLMELFI